VNNTVILRLLGVLEQLHEEKGVPKQDSLTSKNIIKSDNSTFDSDKKERSGLSGKHKKNLVETFNLFNAMFFEHQKKMRVDEREKTKVSQIAKKQATPPPLLIQKPKEKSKFGFGSILAGLLLVVGGIAAFVTGLLNNGPFKGILKLLSRVGLSGGLKLLKLAIKPFVEILGKIIRFPLKVLGKFGKFFGEGVAKLSKFLFGGAAKMVGKVFGKLGGGSLMKMVMKFIKPLAKVFKRIPIVGTILSIAFAWSRFNSGDVVGGVIDVLSGLAGLVDIALPGVGSAMSIGFDVLNAVLDAKSDQGEGKPKRSKMDILGEMSKSVGSWIWSKRMYIPILSSVNRFMMAWDDFKGGNIASGFGNFGLALSNLVTGVDGKVIMDGISGFMGLFESSGGSETAPRPNKSFISEMSEVVGNKITELWEWVKQKIKDGIAGLIPGGKAVLDFAANTAKSTAELTGHITEKAKKAYDGVKSSYDDINKSYVEFQKKGAEKLKSITDNVWNYFKGPTDENPKRGAVIASAKKITTPTDENPKRGAVIASAKKITTPIAENPFPKNEKEEFSLDNIFDKRDVSNGGASAAKAMYKLSFEANQYLKIIANNTALLVNKMSNGSGGGSGPTIVMSPQQAPQKTPSISIDNNRMGFASSAYALG
jgi:hypothetical protein